MNVYDFDKTVFYPDSSFCFVQFCLRHYPRAVLNALPGVLRVGLHKYLKQAKMRELKEQIFSFLPALDSVDQIVEDFWKEYKKNLTPWYLRQKRADDVIISASPEFLLRPITEELDVRLIATRMDPYSGRIIGNNCHDVEKVCRYLKEYPDEKVDSFYSDSLSDSPMAWFADEAWLVKNGNELEPWPNK